MVRGRIGAPVYTYGAGAYWFKCNKDAATGGGATYVRGGER